jgi:hypothetical protein
VAALELQRFDLILAPRQPAANIAWRPIVVGVAGDDRRPEIVQWLGPMLGGDNDPIHAAEVFEAALAGALAISR